MKKSKIRLADIIFTFEKDLIFAKSYSSGIGAKISSYDAAILSLCYEPKSKQEIIQLLEDPEVEESFDNLVDVGLLVSPELAKETPVIFANYAGIEVHRRMLSDKIRIEKSRQAIFSIVKNRDWVFIRRERHHFQIDKNGPIQIYKTIFNKP